MFPEQTVLTRGYSQMPRAELIEELRAWEERHKHRLLTCEKAMSIEKTIKEMSLLEFIKLKLKGEKDDR